MFSRRWVNWYITNGLVGLVLVLLLGLLNWLGCVALDTQDIDDKYEPIRLPVTSRL